MTLNRLTSKTLERYFDKLSIDGSISKEKTNRVAMMAILAEFIECDSMIVSEEDYRRIERYASLLSHEFGKCELPLYGSIPVNPVGDVIFSARVLNDGTLRITDKGELRIL